MAKIFRRRGDVVLPQSARQRAHRRQHSQRARSNVLRKVLLCPKNVPSISMVLMVNSVYVYIFWTQLPIVGVRDRVCDAVPVAGGVLGNDEVLKSKSMEFLERLASTEDAYWFVGDLLPRKILEWIEPYAKPASINIDMLLPCLLASFSGVAGMGISRAPAS